LLRAVIASLVDPAARIRQAAENALQQRGGAWMISAVAAEMLPTIEGARSAFNSEVSVAATKWATHLQRAQLRRTMLNSGLATALTLSRALQSSSVLMRTAAAEALWQTGDVRAVPALREALRDPDEGVRRMAAIALGTLHWRPATLEELIAWEVAMCRWPSVVSHGEPALDALLFAATHSTPPTQADAIESVAQLNCLRAMLQLVPQLESPHAIVSKATARALKALDWVPVNHTQAIRQAIELEDWSSVASFGAAAVAPLAIALKASHGEIERRAAILKALHSLQDPKAIGELILLCRDGEVASISVSALQQALRQCARNATLEDLQAILALKNVVHFRFTYDAEDGRNVRSGIELVDLTGLRQLAEEEFSRRTKESISVTVTALEEEGA
jgi:HEAT repeat protein